MTFSVAKSCLALVAGFALAENRIAGLDDPVAEAAPDPGFDTAQNRAVTWRHLLDQTSEWEGEVWGKPDRIDRNRVVGLKARDAPPKGGHRDLRRPGTYWEYNDVRVNRLAMSLTQVFRGSLEDEFRLRIMDPIGASAHWRWHAYRNAWIEIDGRRVPSVPGGGHWGGGIVVSALDLARLGLLVLRGGAWGERRVLPAGWSDEILRPCRIQPGYGLMWWLNPGYCASAAAPQSSFFAMGAGSHVLWIDRGLDLVVVLRWIHKAHIEGVVARIMHAVRPPP